MEESGACTLDTVPRCSENCACGDDARGEEEEGGLSCSFSVVRLCEATRGRERCALLSRLAVSALMLGCVPLSSRVKGTSKSKSSNNTPFTGKEMVLPPELLRLLQTDVVVRCARIRTRSKVRECVGQEGACAETYEVVVGGGEVLLLRDKLSLPECFSACLRLLAPSST